MHGRSVTEGVRNFRLHFILLTIVVLAGAVLVTAPESAVSADGPLEPSSLTEPSPAMGPTSPPGKTAALADVRAAQEMRQTPKEIAAREKSRTAFEDLTPGEAEALAARSFSGLILAPSFGRYEPPTGLELDHYLGKDAALLTPDQGAQNGVGADQVPGSVVQSLLPLRAPNEAGQLRPTDSSLVSAGNHFEPANPPVETRFPTDLSAGIKLPEIDLVATPENAAEAGAATVLGEDKAFYSEIATDTDFLAAPSEGGAEALWQLRSARSPEQVRLELDLPHGAEVRATFHGLAAEVVRGGETLATIEPPAAFDADHAAVPIKMRPDGNGVVLTIAHRSGDWKYPILVDPAIDQAYFWPIGTPCPSADRTNYPGWRWTSILGDYPDSPPWSYFWPGCDASWGLVSEGYPQAPGNWHWQGWWAQWQWAPPPNSYVQSVTFNSAGLYFSSNLETACSAWGIYSTRQGAWGGSESICYPFDHWDLAYSAGSADDDDNVAVSQLWVPQTWQYINSFWTTLRGAHIIVSDRHAPTVGATSPNSPWAGENTWIDDGSAQYSMVVSGSDLGLGIKKLYLSGTAANPPPATHTCSDAQSNRCPGYWDTTFSYRMDEGRHRVAYQSEDLVGNQSATSYGPWQLIDRSGPSVQASGTMTDDDFYNVDITATDGNDTSPSAQRAGVTGIKVFLDGTEVASDTQPCPPGSCPMTASYELPFDGWTAGTHSVRIEATDALGHIGSQTLTPTVPVNTSIERGPLGTTESSTALFTFTSPDTGTFECRVDGASWQPCTSPHTITNIAAGHHVMEARTVRGADRDPTPAAREWSVAPGPDTAIATGPSGVRTTRTETVVFSSPDPTARFECRWDSDTWSTCAVVAVRTDLQDGSHSFEVRAVDLNNRPDPTPAHLAWRTDAADPARGSCDGQAAAAAAPAVDLLSANHPTVIAPSGATTWDAESVDPSLQLPESGQTALLSTGSLTNVTVGCRASDGFELDTAWGGLNFSPLAVSSGATQATVVNGDTAVFGATGAGALSDTVIRPTAQGLATFVQVRSPSASQTYQWRVAMPGGVRLKVLDNGAVAMLADPTPVGSSTQSSSVLDYPDGTHQDVLLNASLVSSSEDGSLMLPPAYQAAGSLLAVADAATRKATAAQASAQLDRSANAITAAVPKLGASDILLAVLDRPWAVDASGQSVPASLSVDRDVITLTISHTGSYAYPIIADPDLTDCEARTSPCGNFDSASAAAYAYKWRNGFNPNYQRYVNDCTGFVSQVLKAGRMRFAREFEHGDGSWWSLKRPRFAAPSDWTESWNQANTLQQHLRDWDLVRRIPTGTRDYEAGDILFYRWKNPDEPDEISHTNVVSSVTGGSNGTPYVVQHSRRYPQPIPLSDFRHRAHRHNGGIAEFIHLRPIHTRINLPG
jgi:hypothetical protein